MLNDIKLELVGNIFIFILLILTFIAITFFIYRRTNPPVSTALRRILMLLRAFSLAIIVFILFEPLLSITFHRVQKPIIAVLIDTSASMSLQDASVRRDQETIQVLQQPLFQETSEHFYYEFFTFSDGLQALQHSEIDSLLFNADGTDMTNALQQLSEKMDEKYLASVVLISDGNYNIGENPARIAQNYNVPIYPIAIGDPSEQKDIVISKVATNQITYANTKVPVDATIKATGYKGKKVQVNLKQAGLNLESKIVELTDHAMETKVRFYYTPKEAGNQKYSIEIPATEGELTVLNNKKNFYTRVLKSKMQILFIAGGPSLDYLFLKRNLNADENIEVTFWTLKNNREFYEGQFPTSADKFKQYDAIVLVDFPRRNTPSQAMTVIEQLVRSKNKPLLLIHGKDSYYPSLRPIQSYLPIDLQVFPSSEQLVSFRLTAEGLNHPLVRLADSEIENQNRWGELPPVYYAFRNIRLVPGATTLLEIDKQQSQLHTNRNVLPLIVARKMNQQKSIVILGNGIWRWDFLMQGIGKSNEYFQRFFSNCIRWLVTGEDSKLVRIFTDKKIYRSGEKVSFTAETYFDDYRPLNGAEVNVTVTRGTKEHVIELHSIGDGKYEGEFQVLEGGDYSFKGQAYYQDRLLGEDAGRFSMEEFSLEFIDTRMNEPLLQQIAYNSNGKYFTSSDMTTLANEFNFPEKKIIQNRQWEIWNKIILLISVIVLLSVEWFIRKKKGML